ncbi:MAG: AMP-binding protein [Spirochaetia bacterium]
MVNLEKHTLQEMLNHSSQKHRDRPSLSYVDGKSYTYGEFRNIVVALSKHLAEKGVKHGDKVALLSENMPAWGFTYFSVTTMGAVCVPILPDFTPPQITSIIEHSGSKIVFVSEKLLEKLEISQLPELEYVITIPNFQVKNINKNGTIEKTEQWDIESVEQQPNFPYQVEESDLAVLIYTSGTTGASKGVMLTHKNLVFDTLMALYVQDIEPEDVFLSMLPLSHTYECTIGFFMPISKGAQICYLDKPPTPRVLMEAMQTVRPTMIVSVPLVIEKIFKSNILPQLTKNGFMEFLYNLRPIQKILHKAAGKKLYQKFGGRLRFFGIGGAPLAPDVERFMRDSKFPYAIGYGLTETSPLIAGCNPSLTRYRSTGNIMRGIQARIADVQGEHGEGEIQVKGDIVMQGYYRAPELTKAVFTEDGWFKTGDLGVLTKDGYLYIKGRSKNLILGPSGENIYPEEIESIINEYHYVLESMVTEKKGKIVALVHLNYDEIMAHFGNLKESASQVSKKIGELLTSLKAEVNKRVSTFARINEVVEQKEPFEKTPTKKIKRYLYQEGKRGEAK